MKKFLEVAIEAAREAGAMLRAEFDRPKKISYKGEVDIVTESDRRVGGTDRRATAQAVSRITRSSRKKAAPGRGRAKILLARGPARRHHEFRARLSVFRGVDWPARRMASRSLARSLNPIADELFTAARGEGAYLNGKRIHVSPIETLSESLVGTGFPPHQRKQQREHGAITGSLRCARMACAAMVPRRSIFARWPAGASKPSGNSD